MCGLDGTWTLYLGFEVQIRASGIRRVLVVEVALPMMRGAMVPSMMPMSVMTVTSPMVSVVTPMTTVADLCDPGAEGLCETGGYSEIGSSDGLGRATIQPHTQCERHTQLLDQGFLRG